MSCPLERFGFRRVVDQAGFISINRRGGRKPDQDCSIANINAVLCAGFSKTKVKQVDSRPLTKMGVGSSGFGVLADR